MANQTTNEPAPVSGTGGLDEPAIDDPASDPELEVATKKRSRRPRSKKLIIGLAILVFFALVAVVGPSLTLNPNLTGPDALAGPSWAHPLGTTNLGQDVLAQVVNGARGSLFIGLVAGVLATVFSMIVGIIGGYVGGLVDEGFSLLSNVVLVIPSLPLIILVTDYASSRGAITIALVIALTGWAPTSRVLRSQTLSLRGRDYVDAARVSGESVWRIIGFEVMPNLLPIIANSLVFGGLFAILTEAGLSFLGLGSENASSWGSILYFAQNAQALILGAWWWFVPPGLCIVLVGMGLSLINFSIDELVNPKLRTAPSTPGSKSKGSKDGERDPSRARSDDHEMTAGATAASTGGTK